MNILIRKRQSFAKLSNTWWCIKSLFYWRTLILLALYSAQNLIPVAVYFMLRDFNPLQPRYSSSCPVRWICDPPFSFHFSDEYLHPSSIHWSKCRAQIYFILLHAPVSNSSRPCFFFCDFVLLSCKEGEIESSGDEHWSPQRKTFCI